MRTKRKRESTWQGCYDAGWKGLIADEAFAAQPRTISRSEQALVAPDGPYTTRPQEGQVMSHQPIQCAQCQQDAVEEWRPVVCAELLYHVSNFGRIKTLHTIGRACKKKIVSQTPNSKGYMRVRLTTLNRDFTIVVHRLVLESFIGPRPSKHHECNHKDGIKSHNHVDNLEWVTPKENAAHAGETGLWKPHIGDAHGMAIVTAADIPFIRSMKGKITGKALAERFGVCAGTIHAIWQGRNWKHVN